MVKTAFLLSLLMVSASAFQMNMFFGIKKAPAPAKSVVPATKPAGKAVAKAAPAPVKSAAKPAAKPAAKAAPAPAAKAAPVKKVVAAPAKKVVVAAPAKKAAPAPAPKMFSSNSGAPAAIFLTGFPEGGISSSNFDDRPAPRSSFAGGLVGADVEAGEFDPFKLSEGISQETLDWYRAAELKHGRVCMLASLGILVAAAVTLPDPVFYSSGALSAATKLFEERPAAVWQIVTALAAIEVSSLFGNLGSSAGFEQGDREPGDLGWDPLNFKDKYGLDDPAKFDVMRLKELKNGRLAMLMTLGLLAQEAVSGKGVYEMFQ